MTPTLRWAVMRAILMFHNCEGLCHKTVSTDHNLWRERRAEADSSRGPSVHQPNALPLGHTGSLESHQHWGETYWSFYCSVGASTGGCGTYLITAARTQTKDGMRKLPSNDFGTLSPPCSLSWRQRRRRRWWWWWWWWWWCPFLQHTIPLT